MSYEKQTWVNGVTPLDAEHLNHMEQGISQLSEEKVSLPKANDGSIIPGTAGWYAVSDGAGGITWVDSAPSTGGETTH